MRVRLGISGDSEYAHRRCGYVGYHEVQRRKHMLSQFHRETAGYEFGSVCYRDKLPFFSRSLSQRSVEVSFVKATFPPSLPHGAIMDIVTIREGNSILTCILD